MKVNVDTSICMIFGNSGLGCVIRNNSGSMVCSLGRRLLGSWSMDNVEAMIILFGLQLAFDAGAQDIIVESDAFSGHQYFA